MLSGKGAGRFGPPARVTLRKTTVYDYLESFDRGITVTCTLTLTTCLFGTYHFIGAYIRLSLNNDPLYNIFSDDRF